MFLYNYNITLKFNPYTINNIFLTHYYLFRLKFIISNFRSDKKLYFM